MIVADTNLIAYLWIPGTHASLAETVVRRDPEWSAPLLWRSELRSVLALCLRKRLMDPPRALELAARAEEQLAREYPVPSSQVLRCVAESKCSAHDCELVALSRELGTPLGTTDRRLVKTLPGEAVHATAFAGT